MMGAESQLLVGDGLATCAAAALNNERSLTLDAIQSGTGPPSTNCATANFCWSATNEDSS